MSTGIGTPYPCPITTPNAAQKMVSPITITNTGTTDLILTPGTAWVTGPTNTDKTDNFDDLLNTPLCRNSLRTLITMSSKLEEFFDYKYHLHPAANSYSGMLCFSCDIRRAEFVADTSTIIQSSWSEPIFSGAKGDTDNELKVTELLQAVAKMIYGVMCFRSVTSEDYYTSTPREPLKDSTHAFLLAIAKGFVVEDAEVPEEALGKLALLSF